MVHAQDIRAGDGLADRLIVRSVPEKRQQDDRGNERMTRTVPGGDVRRIDEEKAERGRLDTHSGKGRTAAALPSSSPSVSNAVAVHR